MIGIYPILGPIVDDRIYFWYDGALEFIALDGRGYRYFAQLVDRIADNIWIWVYAPITDEMVASYERNEVDIRDLLQYPTNGDVVVVYEQYHRPHDARVVRGTDLPEAWLPAVGIRYKDDEPTGDET